MIVFASPLFPAAVILLALAAWLSFAVFNNIRDPSTNRYLLGQMFTMQMLAEDPHMGKGLLTRSVDSRQLPMVALRVVVAVQLILAIALWISAGSMGLAWLGWLERETAVTAGNLAIAGFTALWSFFLCGGMWFGYWIKMSQVQQVHLTLLVIGMLAFLLIQAAA
jgi:predicted small integral membrane protein